MKINCFTCKKEIDTNKDDYRTYTWGQGEMSDTEYCCSEACKPDFEVDSPSIFIKGELEANIRDTNFDKTDFRYYTRNGKYNFYWSDVEFTKHKTWVVQCEPEDIGCYPDEHICGNCGHETNNYEDLYFDGNCVRCKSWE